MKSVMISFRDWLLGQSTTSAGIPRILLLDGGVSTHLEDKLLLANATSKGATSKHFRHRELWSSSLLLDVSGQNLIRQGHLDWLEAGANVISTVTYQCHFEEAYWPKPKAGDSSILTEKVMNTMWSDGLKLAKQAVQEHESSSKQVVEDDISGAQPHFVLASSGCYGAILANGAEYTGEYGSATVKDLEMFHRRKFESILSASKEQREIVPAGIALETVPSIAECRALRNVLLESDRLACLDIGVFVSLSCRDEQHLNDGTPLTHALDVLGEVPTHLLQAIGLNCCDSAHLPGLIDVLVSHLAEQYQSTGVDNTAGKRGIVLYPNSGEVWEAATESWQDGTGCTDSHDLSSRLVECIRQVERLWQQYHPTVPCPSILVGGCCRTRPTTIAALRRAADEHLLATKGQAPNSRSSSTASDKV